MTTPTTFVKWDDIVRRYTHLSKLGGGADTLEPAYVVPAEQELHGRLANRFTVPFSSTNLTAVDLVIDMVRVRAGIGKEKAINEVMERLDKRIERLLAGQEAMLVSSNDGSVAAVYAATGEAVWGSDTGYHPTFGHGEVIDFFVDSSRLYDEEQERIS